MLPSWGETSKPSFYCSGPTQTRWRPTRWGARLMEDEPVTSVPWTYFLCVFVFLSSAESWTPCRSHEERSHPEGVTSKSVEWRQLMTNHQLLRQHNVKSPQLQHLYAVCLWLKWSRHMLNKRGLNVEQHNVEPSTICAFIFPYMEVKRLLDI